jgi:hypothetical protein
MTNRATGPLKERVGKAIVAHAFFRLESALTISLTILLAFFLPRPLPWWRWWVWVILGATAEALIVYTSITDERTGRKVVAEMLREEYDPSAIKTRRYREKVEQALEYREQIERVLGDTGAGVLRDHLYDSTAGIADWIGLIFTMARRLDAYERDELLHRDMKEASANLARLRKALADEDDPAVAGQIRSTLAAKEAQQANLRTLENRMEQAEFRLEETLASLGTVYSQYQLIRARRLSGSKARRLSEDIREQVQGLQDIVASMNEVYGQG